MTGNVGEWTASCATPDYANLTAAGTDASGDCSRRMVRGGSWGTIPRQQRSAERMRYAPSDRDDSIGIRVVKTVTD
jgi:formylglycine-generating enzyme required for sulfatase activity